MACTFRCPVHVDHKDWGNLMKLKITALAVLLLTTGCATQPLNFTPSEVKPAGIKIDASLMKVTVSLDSTQGNTLKKKRVDAGGFEAQLAQLWQNALDDSLGRAAIFNDDSKRRVNLSVRIIRLALPKGAMVMHTGTLARYELIDRSTGQTIYSTDIESDGRVSGDYAFMGTTRARESVNRSIQNNISQFIEQLKGAHIAPN